MTLYSSAKSTYSVRLSGNVLVELQRRAKEEKTSVGALIRRSINHYLSDRDMNEAVAEMEHRIITTINRSINQLDRHQLQTRRVADISLAQYEYLLFHMIANNVVKRQDGEDNKVAYRRIHSGFMKWLPGALSANGMVKQMIRQAMEPSFIVEEATPQPSGPASSNGVKPTGSAQGETSNDSTGPA